jgi:hypothetical protein
MRANVCSLGMQDTSCMQDTRMFGFRANMSSVKTQSVPSCSNLSRLFGIDMHEEQLLDGYCRFSDSQVKGAPMEAPIFLSLAGLPRKPKLAPTPHRTSGIRNGLEQAGTWWELPAQRSDLPFRRATKRLITHILGQTYVFSSSKEHNGNSKTVEKTTPTNKRKRIRFAFDQQCVRHPVE